MRGLSCVNAQSHKINAINAKAACAALGSFRRAFHLPDYADQDNTEAKFDKGALTIAIPRLEIARSNVKKPNVKKIEVG